MYQTVSTDGTKIAYDLVGDGPPVIIVGGAFHDRNASADLAQALSPDFTVVTYDRRGRGGSDDAPAYSVAREVEDLDVLIEEIGSPAALYGISSGGVLALEAAASGCSVSKIAAFEPPYRCGQGPELSRDVLPTLTELARAGKRPETVEYFLTAVMGLPPQRIEHMRQEPMWPGLEAISHTLVYDATVVGDRSWPAMRMATVTVPVLVISSAASAPWMRHTAETVAQLLAGGKHLAVPGPPHGAAPEVIAPALASFLTG